MAGFLGFFDCTKPGKGISKDEPKKKGIALYFDIFLKRFWKLISLNLIYIIASVPAIIISWFVSTYFITLAAAQEGLNIEEVASTLSLLCVFVTIIFLHICGSGPAAAALTYVLRKYVNDTHAWVWIDFRDNFKSNFKQGIASYLINTIVFSLLIFAFLFYSFAQSTSVFFVLKIVALVIAVLFYMMQMYIYQMMSGFELRLKYIYKNAFLLTILGLPKNILSAIVSGAIIYAAFSITLRVPLAGLLIIGLIIYPLLSFTQIFMTNSTVKKYMVQPSTNQNADETTKDDFDSEFEDA